MQDTDEVKSNPIGVYFGLLNICPKEEPGVEIYPSASPKQRM